MRPRFREVTEINELKKEKTLPVFPSNPNSITMTTDESKKFWNTIFESLQNGDDYDTAIQNARDVINMSREAAQLPDQI